MGPLDASITNQEYEGIINVTLKRSQHSDLNNVIFLYLNINSIKNKVGYLDKIVAGNIDILCTAETKLDECFPNNQYITIISLYILHITDNKGCMMLFVTSYLPSRRLIMILKFHLIYTLYLLK